MIYKIIFAPQAAEDLKCLSARNRSSVRDAIEKHLRFEPMKLSRTRIKRLRSLRHPQYRLRIGDFRVFYDVSKAQVEILAIIPESHAADWLEEGGGS